MSVREEIRLFEAPEHAKLYVESRPLPPDSLITKILNFLDNVLININLVKDDGAAHVRRSLAVDVGCGSGQATSLLAPHFSAVRAFDVSAAQVAQAVDRKRRRKEEEEEEGGRRSMDNVEFQCSPAERLPLESSSADLVSVCTAAHWFDLTEFFKEVDRVLRPGGVLAMYSMCGAWVEVRGRPDVQRAIHGWYEETRSYAHERHHLYVARGYETMPTPYPESTERLSGHRSDLRWDLSTFADFFRSLSYHRRMAEARGQEAAEEAVRRLVDRTAEALGIGGPDGGGEGEALLDVSHPFFGLLARKPDLQQVDRLQSDPVI